MAKPLLPLLTAAPALGLSEFDLDPEKRQRAELAEEHHLGGLRPVLPCHGPARYDSESIIWGLANQVL